ncbi:YncE family protein [Hymenobacter norwichensis]|uniref:YncE family protein n=1 Tax=Hymenobacter norwichensis TaxID=223903 RepID=UPI0003B6D94B|nr:YncE family protein [Hymenobacter norwichensis]
MKPFSTFSSVPTRLVLGAAAAFSLLACDPSSTPEPAEPTVETKTVFVVNEGNFLQSNAEISSFSKATNKVSNLSLFSAANSRPLGDVAQNMSVRDSTGYIVVNNSNKLEVVNLRTFRSLATITGLKLPRYFAAASAEKGYVTETVSYSVATGQVSVINLKTNTVIKTIAVGKQPEHLLVVGNRVYVTNNGGSTVTVINTDTDTVEGTVTVGDAPNSLVLDRNNRVWVLSSGRVVYDINYNVDYNLTSKGSLSSFTPGSFTASTRIFNTNLAQPGRLSINGSRDQLYYTFQGGVYRLSINDNDLPTTPLFRRRSIYGLGIDPQDNTIYSGIAPSFSTAGQVVRFRNTGAAIDSFTVKIGPNGFVFY